MSELQLTQAISKLASSSPNTAKSVKDIVNHLLSFPGVRAVRIQPRGSLFEFLDGPLVWGELRSDPQQPAVSARAAIQLGARSWGDLHLYFDLNTIASDSPVRLVQFAAEQVARVVAGQHLIHEQEELGRQIEYFREQLVRRKNFHRARGLLAEQHAISELAAGELLRRRSTQNAVALEAVTATVIRDYDRRRTRPSLARRTA